ncbi:hypothetical protein LZL87_004753 [Fusarium oxysporum]|nr:hypothetical protein LZL87_004753 [Fusarium oxysporum]
MASWNSLPPEVHRMVLQSAIPRKKTPNCPFPTAPVLATVSREWQDFFERRTFKDLALTNSDLYAFAKAVKSDVSRLGYIRTLRLRINLMPYSFRLRGKPESATNATHNNQIFTHAMAVLLKTLASWSGDHGGLELELDVRSPSDCTYFDFINELHDDFLFRFQDEGELFDAVGEFYETRRQEIKERGRPPFLNFLRNWTIQPGYDPVSRLRGNDLELKPSLIKRVRAYSQTARNLPATPIVKGLVIRRAAPRLIALQSLGRVLRESFVALESFSYSTYLSRMHYQERDFIEDLSTELFPSLPATLKRFRYSKRPVLGLCNPRMSDINQSSLSLLFARACHHFTELCVPPDLDPVVFFNEIIARGKCDESKLEKLAMATRYLSQSSNQNMVTFCLTLAARAAATMPRLRILEMWCSYTGYACLFRRECFEHGQKLLHLVYFLRAAPLSTSPGQGGKDRGSFRVCA